jgi:hypothetical protein
MPSFPEDPTKWTFEHLFLWFTTVPRTIAPDKLWVHHARACIHERSELIWERIKGALGVPPELDMDGDDDEQGRQDSFISPDVTAVVITDEEVPTAQDSPEGEGDHHFVSSPVDADYDSDYNPLSLSIENIMSTSTPPSMTPSGSYSSNPPPLSLPSSLAPSLSMSQSMSHSPLIAEAGLQNISEDQEENEDDLQSSGNEVSDEQSTATEDYTNAKSVDASQPQGTVQGIRISTSPLPHSPTILPPLHQRAHSFTSSPSPQSASLPHGSASPSGLPPSPHARPRSLRSSSFGSLHSSSSVAYDPVGDRIPGNPLFPSNFARLALGPTLRAK